MGKYRLFLFLLLVVALLKFNSITLYAQDTVQVQFNWIDLDKGISYCECNAPEKSILNDSKLTIVKVDPSKYDFNFLTATEFGAKLRTAEEWANEFNSEIIINAGMYSLKKNHPNKGYLKNYGHVNNPTISGYYNAMIVTHPIDTLLPAFQIVDLTCTPWDSIQNRYHSFCQGMRMFDCDGNPMAFSKKPDQSCSMILLSTDIYGMIYIVFTRSPYTHRTMLKFLKSFPLELRQTVYLEGGPEASLYIKTDKNIIRKFGCYVSKTYERDDNDHFWEIPNVIGISKKNHIE
jgi:hypothetical protein